ncbi:hypothetical protein K1719_001885 [Acacia pycnantha]|nr:hypothetical protein K1719_001885 [Acacia pycnantha]
MRQQLVDGDPPYLAEEIITDILKRLPVKSLIRFQCVCKHWKNLIKSPCFINDHLDYSTPQNSCLLLEYNFPRKPLQLRLVDWEMQIHQIHPLRTFSWIIGSINGLLCLVNDDCWKCLCSFFLWNPATREVRQLPMPRKHNKPCRCTAGFGYSINDYKIVRIYCDLDDAFSGAEVYSLRTNSWKDVDCGVLQGVHMLFSCFNISANGSIFWTGINLDEQDETIISYDIAREVFTLIPLSIRLFTRLAVYDDKPALVFVNHKWIELWVLEKGIDSSSETWSWIKKHTKRCPSDSLLWWTIWRNQLTVCDNYSSIHGGVVPLDLSLYLFKIPTNEMKAVGLIPKVDGILPHRVFNYVESLVPLRHHPRH